MRQKWQCPYFEIEWTYVPCETPREELQIRIAMEEKKLAFWNGRYRKPMAMERKVVFCRYRMKLVYKKKKKHFSIQYYKVITFPFSLFVHIFVIIFLTLYLKLYSSISVKSFTNFVHLNIHFLLDQTQKPIENSVVTFKAMVITQTKINEYNLSKRFDQRNME